MTQVDFASLVAPIADGDPCGPDLDLAGDAEYMNFVARAEGLLPISYFDGEGKPFDRSSIDVPAELEAMQPLLARTRDLRLLVLLAKFLVINRDLEGFTTCIGAIAALLRERWDDVHPRGEDGDFSFRMAALASLDDLPPVVLPLQYLPIAEHRRFGPITYRHQMVATGQTKAREGEDAPDATTIAQALAETELSALVARRDWCQAAHTALADIRKISTEQAGYEQAVSLDKLPPLLDKILALLDGAVAKRDPAAALAPSASAEPAAADAAPAAAAAGANLGSREVRSTVQAAAALAAVADYFGRREPSNPALLLVRQAEQLIGKSFLDVMRILVPGHVDQAIVYIGGDQAFELPVERLAEFASVPELMPAEDSDNDSSFASDEGAGAGPHVNGVGSPAAAGANGADVAQSYSAATRREAGALMQEVAAYYRAVEPSSPIPYLTDRARGLADRDILSILKEFQPESALKSMKDEG